MLAKYDFDSLHLLLGLDSSGEVLQANISPKIKSFQFALNGESRQPSAFVYRRENITYTGDTFSTKGLSSKTQLYRALDTSVNFRPR